MVMLYVPAGEFLKGAADNDSDANPYEKPQHRVYLDAYWIDRTEVTNAMFARFVAATGYNTDAEKAGKGPVLDPAAGKWQDNIAGVDWAHPRGPVSDLKGLEAHPVVLVSWNDSAWYCKWAGRRLPSEAEWEKAARGTDGRQYPWGDGWDVQSTKRLNFADRNLNVADADKNADDGYQFTAPVGSYPAGMSPYGALDMAGNVWEWVADWFDEKPYLALTARNPTGPASGQNRLLRGGSWIHPRWLVRAASRMWGSPVAWQSNDGFRCARSD